MSAGTNKPVRVDDIKGSSTKGKKTKKERQKTKKEEVICHLCIFLEEVSSEF